MSRGRATDLELHRCWVGRLHVQGLSLSRLVINSGSVRSINCPAPHEENPFVGSVSISPDVDFPTSPTSKLLGGSQGYRNIRHHLEDLQNVPAANLMRHIELQTDFHYREDTGLRRFINRVYGIFSDHGNSPGKPLVWMVGLWVFVGVALFFFDGGAQALPDPLFAGWREVLRGEGNWSQFARTIYLILQSTFNPLGLLGSRHLIVAESEWAHLLLIVQGLCSDLWIAMSIFGIRKRFKVS